ncbi:hypothetical protein LCGC14_2361960 [marine sediment metagenome]|uniref:Extensin-like C-terminal domain-containing protein n=1 Tax=marine sediment metagenome TaxID=412755 RepID=A0A0F9F182_9ZZZZ
MGIPLSYERRSSDDVWGDLAPTKEVGLYFNSSFRRKLDDCFVEINKVFAHRAMKGIISAGAWVDKPGMHKLARAFDLDGIVWEGGNWRATRFVGGNELKMYLVIQAICMKHFGTVLGYLYNKAHEDHIHMDDGTEPGFRHNSRSIVTFIQQACKTFLGQPLAEVDGSWGPKTAEVMRSALGLPFEQYPNDTQYFAFLDMVIATVKKEDRRVDQRSEKLEVLYQHSDEEILKEIRKGLDILELRLDDG